MTGEFTPADGHDITGNNLIGETNLTPAEEPQTVSIYYGTKAAPMGAVAAVDPGAGAQFACAQLPHPCLVIGPHTTQALRFNNAPSEIFPQAPNPDITDPFEMIQQRMLPLCDPWNRAAIEFVERYLQAIEACVRENAVSIAAQTVACGSLFEPRDWVYAAPCPLPLAHVPITTEAAGSVDPTLIPVDFAFWTGEKIVALDVVPPALLPKAIKARRDLLAASGILHIEGIPGDDMTCWMNFFAKLVPASCTTFWQDEAIPVGPFPGMVLDALDAMVGR